MRFGMFMMTAAVCAATSVSSAALAVSDPLSFEKLERGYQWTGDTDSAKAALTQAIPPGTSFWTALDILKAAGAQCVGDIHDPSLAHCTYSERITINDYHPADAVWEVCIRLQDGSATSLVLDREVDER
ncbi:hypothetical protein SIDU_01650 [Sphingobium indicum B90A]|uniref:PepSY domain-containing protein n=2 Tax=Sphingobium indicum TaxID=332055 RepID=A0A1L5BKA9_SPHIB|nr:hypothetical protein SIDU_01650 [Sphingobium indicum B90A]